MIVETETALVAAEVQRDEQGKLYVRTWVPRDTNESSSVHVRRPREVSR